MAPISTDLVKDPNIEFLALLEQLEYTNYPPLRKTSPQYIIY